MRDILKSLFQYTVALLVSLIILVGIIKPWSLHLSIPFENTNDSLLHQLWVRGTLDNGWFIHNDALGMPFELDASDYPQSEGLHLVIMKLIGIAYPHYGIVYNGYLLLTFPLTALCALFALRQLGIRYGPALVASLLYTFLPYHWSRMMGHPYLAAYYVIPLALLATLWVYLDEGILYSWGPEASRRPTLRLGSFESLVALVVAFLVGSAGIYYAVLSCFFFLVAGLAAAAHRKRVYPFANAAILIGTVAFAGVINLAPNFLHMAQHGFNGAPIRRQPADTEEYALKIVEMLLPTDGHRVPALARLKAKYALTAPLVTENNDAALGVVGTVGFLVILVRFLFLRPADSRPAILDACGVLTVSAVLLATVGGFSSLISYAMFESIRGYTRICIYIAFLCLLAMAYVAGRFAPKIEGNRWGRVGFATMLGAVLVVGILDQNSPIIGGSLQNRNASPSVREYQNDADFVREIESRMPDQAMIFQLPYLQFYGEGCVHKHRMNVVCDHLRPYLHSKKLRWSYGSMEGQVGHAWNLQMTANPADEMVEALAITGFRGIYLDTFGYEDGGVALAAALGQALGTQPIVDANNRILFFDMSSYVDQLERHSTPEEWQAKREALLDPGPFLVFGQGFFPPEPALTGGLRRWCEAKGALEIVNASPKTRTATLKMECRTATPESAPLRIESALFNVSIAIDQDKGSQSQTVTVPPGRHPVRFFCEGPEEKLRVFQVFHCTLEEKSQVPIYRPGIRIDLTNGASRAFLPVDAYGPKHLGQWSGSKFLREDWYEPDDWGQWSGYNSALQFRLEQVQPLRLRMLAKAYGEQKIVIGLNGRDLTTLQATGDPNVMELDIPADAVTEENLLTFKLPDARSPQSVGASDDSRILGLGVTWIELVPSPEANANQP
jgi:phosphoglycerol transferase